MNIELRRLTGDDAPRVREILATPEVSTWWGDPDEETAELISPEDPDTTTYAIEFEGAVVGVIQSSEEPTPGYRHAGIDLAVHPDWHGRGIGTAAIHRLATHLIEERGHHRLTIDPAAENERAIAVYRRLGFRPVGVLRQYERRQDGTWRDGLLMDLLAPELTTP
ncbi:GNAT family N-acetyltransferase [Amycolatopsis sp. YIM 10]|uniref:GNAT family N-acetyltransferase n=1 Tax=Amycolatopsis sp. YIM 10 TaxID=2653857 RepID=UPI0012907AB2|nr:GNAT family protein [Amycolatopsis sp. YIM 10]QFU87434.1 Acetyltransferase YpeA [Amycolatopsis sp. YIM 10]